MQFKEVAELLCEPVSSEKLQTLLAATSHDATLRHALLSMLFPQKERRFVYRRKTTRLLQLWEEAYAPFASALKRNKVDYVSEYRTWRESPTPVAHCVKQRFHLVCNPEEMVARVHARLGHSSFSHFSLHDIQRLRQLLADDRVQEAATMIIQLGVMETQALFLILLRCVSTHVLPKQVRPKAPLFLKYKNDLELLARWSVRDEPAAMLEVEQLRWGVPSQPMLSENVGHHYLLPWMFKSELAENRVTGPENLHLAFVRSAAGVEWWFGVYIRRKPARRVVEKGKKKTTSRADDESDDEEDKKGKQKKVYQFNLLDDVTHRLASHQTVVTCTQKFRDTAILDEERLEGHALHYTLFRSDDKTRYHMQLISVTPLDKTQYVDGTTEAPLLRSTPLKKAIPLDQVMRPVREVSLGHETYTVAVGASERNKEAPGIMVQTKYDGDRMQAHVHKDKVILFTKNGYDVSDKYSDIAVALQRHYHGRKCTPCILDGEIIVVSSSTHKPMPWEDGKWKYNTGEQSVAQANPDSIFVLSTGDAVDDDDTNGDMSLLPPCNRDGLPAHLLQSQGVALPSGGYLQFVVFDLLMDTGEEWLRRPYEARYGQLQKHGLVFTTTGYLKLAESKMCHTSKEIERLLLQTVRDRTEGLMLKKPKGLVRPGDRSRDVVKLKVTGPDINTFVVGAGFNLSGNPRQWGILTAVGSPTVGEVYVRVQSFDGDAQPRILYSVYTMRSRVLVADLLRHNQGDAFVTQTVGGDVVEVRVVEGGQRTVKWPTFTLCIANSRQLQDVQWLVNPLECAFGMSVRGDLRPLHAYGLEILRFPVGRVEFAMEQQSTADTTTQVHEKFAQAAGIEKCMERFIERFTRKLRKWGSVEHMRDLGHLAACSQGFNSLHDKFPKEKDAETVRVFLGEQHPPLTCGEQATLEKGVKPVSQWVQQTVMQELLAAEEEARAKARREQRALFKSANKIELENTMKRLQAIWVKQHWHQVCTSGAFPSDMVVKKEIQPYEAHSDTLRKTIHHLDAFRN